MQRFLILLLVHESDCQAARDHGFHHPVRLAAFYVLLALFYSLVIAVLGHVAVHHIAVYGRQTVVLLHRAAFRQADGIQGQLQ